MSDGGLYSPWLPFGCGPLEAPARMFCLPFAGGGASNFSAWRKRFDGVAVAPLQYPGRETRFNEAPLHDLDTLVEGLAGNRTALVAKMHHALVDGMAAVDVSTVILDPSPEPLDIKPPPRTPASRPGRAAADDDDAVVRGGDSHGTHSFQEAMGLFYFGVGAVRSVRCRRSPVPELPR